MRTGKRFALALKFASLFLWILVGQAVWAVSIDFDGTISPDPASNNYCNAGSTYRLGTNNTVNGQPIDILLTFTAADSEYISPNHGPCTFADCGANKHRCLTAISGEAGA